MMAKYTTKDIRLWALVMTAALTVVGFIQILIWSHQRAALIFWIVGALFLISGLLFPLALKPIYRGWLKFAEALALINTRLILGLMFFLVFTPIGLLLRLFGKDLIKERWDGNARSYFVEREKVPLDRTRYEKLY